MNSVVLISVLCCFKAAYARIELKDFYPYGPANGDTWVPTNDDGSTGLVNIGFPFPFFDEDHESLFVNTNGVISFLRQVSQYAPDAFPLGNQRRLIAPFWADVDTRRGGVVYYRETQDFAVRTRVSEEIRKHFVRRRRFSAKWTMIVTWLNVSAYGGGIWRNTFQTILATDGISSFSIFYYNKIEWTFGSASNIPAQAGFNAGDGIRHFNIPNSRTLAIVNVPSTSNYQVPGLWIFKVDGETVENHGCVLNGGTLELSPRSGTELGGTGVFIAGPCYKPEDQIVCRFNKNINTTAVYVNTEQAYCVTPPLYVRGRIPVELSLDGGATFNFTGIFRSIPLGRNPPDIGGLDVEHWANSSSTNLTWDPNTINSSHVDIKISLFDLFEFRLHKDSLASFEHVPNTGTYKLDFSEENISSNSKRRRRKRRSDTESAVAVVSITSSLVRLKRELFGIVARIFSKVFLLSWRIEKMACKLWFEIQSSNYIAKLQNELPPCPTSLRAIQADAANFVADSGIKRFLSATIFHPGSKLCFRSRNASPSGAGQQCCYDNNGRLMVGPSGGGSLDVASPDKSVWEHFGRDVLPWIACCKLTNDCNKYYKRRPSDDGSRYIPPPVAATRGDPHLATFDGTFFTFNGFGEYVLLEVNNGVDLDFQGRMAPILDDQGQKTKATALTALVIREAGSDIVQVEFNSRRGIDVFVNGDRVEFDEQTRLDFTGVFIVKQNQSEIGIYFNSSVSIDTKAIEDFLTYQISIPQSLKEKTAGLLGFWNDNKDEEFLLPNGSFIPTNSSFRTIHFEFGQKWIVDRNRTLFTYRVGESYDSFVDLVFTPVFLDEMTSLFSDPTLEEEAKDICGGNDECLFDIAVTGKKNVGEATLESFNQLQQRTNDSHIVNKPIFYGCDGVENSNKQTDDCGICGGDNSTCTDCLGNVVPGFVSNGTCGFFHSWNEWSICVKNHSSGGFKTRNRTCSVKGQCLHLGKHVEYKSCSCATSKCDSDDDSKTLEFYLLVAGLPALLLLLLVAMVGLCYCFICNQKKSAPGRKTTAVTHVNSAYTIS